MNTSHLSKYAPQARRDFIAAVTARATTYGLTAKHIEPITEQGDVALIGDKVHPHSVAAKRKKLEDRIQQHGFEQVIEAMAYTWFNRFMAIRYMELHSYLDHGRRVLSHPEKQGAFEILDDCTEIELPGVARDQVIELKLDGSKDEELYRLLLLGQCHALHQAMPFLFEPIDDETELLLPDNLTKTDSLIRHLVDDIPEEDWEQIEIIGWLYQFYISEKKDQVIGKVVKSEDIPAATQLFTPNWIVKYMVQNSLGAQWLATYPKSPLKGQMEYYIEPAEQTDEVKAQLAAITPSTLNPEELTLIDPASGSGHILVEAYELFKAIYLERGYRQRDVARLILEKNLFGLDIDERAAQLTGFALMMKGRADDRRLFEREVKLNVMALMDSTGFEGERLAEGVKLADYGLQPSDLTELRRLFEHATTFGSLIQVPEGLAKKLPALKQLSVVASQDLFVSDALKRLGPLVQQAELLAAQYDAVVANPPYMGSKGMNAPLKKFAKDYFPKAKNDLFACFIGRTIQQTSAAGRIGIVAPFVWMFLSSYKVFRGRLIDETSLTTLVQLEYNAFEPAMVPVASFTLMRRHINNFTGSFVKLSEFKGHQNQAPRALQAISNPDCGWFYRAKPDEFKAIPGGPIAYWLSAAAISSYSKSQSLGQVAYGQPGLQTSNNDMFVRLWAEVSLDAIGMGFASSQDAEASGRKWFPYLKGGDYRKWYGNQNHVVNWWNNGEEIKSYVDNKYPYLKGNIDYVVKDRGYYFKTLISYTKITSGEFSARAAKSGFMFDVAGSSVFPTSEEYWLVAGFLCSKLANMFVRAQNPTLNLQSGDIDNLPILTSELKSQSQVIEDVLKRLFVLSKADWDSYERSWDFQSLPMLTASSDPTPTLESSYTAWITQNRDTIAEMKRLEEENNRLFIDAYGLADELTPDVPIEKITLTVNPAYRYGGKLTEEEQWTRFRQDTMEELVSYAIGCMMGRYSLDAPGLIYAHSGNVGFDRSRYPTFPTDDDGIVPLTDAEWFDDDAAHRLIEFISVAWDETHLEDNLTFLADNLSPKKNESSRETLRRYLCDSFFKDHLQTYKKRPIYFLFSSGKEKAFQCLVYLHRYNEGTLARTRTEYVIPLQGLIASRIEQRDADILAATASSHRKRLEKERDRLVIQRAELQNFDEKLRHFADQRISLELDDGVKVNYGKFSDLLAEVKAVTGTKAD